MADLKKVIIDGRRDHGRPGGAPMTAPSRTLADPPVRRAGLLAAAVFAAAALAGCVETAANAPVASAPPAPLPADVMDLAFDKAIAEQIVGNCRRGFRYNAAYERDAIAALESKYGSNPAWAQGDVRRRIDERAIQNRVFSYAQRRNVVLTNSSTWCAAGSAEKAENTRIGAFLIAR